VIEKLTFQKNTQAACRSGRKKRAIAGISSLSKYPGWKVFQRLGKDYDDGSEERGSLNREGKRVAYLV